MYANVPFIISWQQGLAVFIRRFSVDERRLEPALVPDDPLKTMEPDNQFSI